MATLTGLVHMTQPRLLILQRSPRSVRSPHQTTLQSPLLPPRLRPAPVSAPCHASRPQHLACTVPAMHSIRRPIACDAQSARR